MTEASKDFARTYPEWDASCARITLKDVIAYAGDNDELIDADGNIDQGILEALRFAESHALDPAGDGAIEMARLFVKAVQLFARFLGHRARFELRKDWGERALAVAVRLGDLEAEAQLCAGVIAWPLLQCGRLDECECYCKQGLSAARKINNRRWEGEAARSLSGIARDRLKGDEALQWALLAYACADDANLASMKQGAVLDRAYALLVQGKYAEAEHYFGKALEMAEGDPERYPARCGDLAFAVLSQGRIEEAERLFNTASAHAQKLESSIMIAEGEFNLARIAELRHQHEKARELRERAQLAFTRMGIVRKGRIDQFCQE